MKIHEYNEMMAYLTRPAVNRTGFFMGGTEASQKGATASALKRSADYILSEDEATKIRNILKERKIPGVYASLQKNPTGNYSLRFRPNPQFPEVEKLFSKFNIQESYSPNKLNSLLENIERVITYSTMEYNGIPEENTGFFYEVIVTKGMIEVNQFDESGEFLKGGFMPLSNYPVSLSNTFIEKEK